MLRQVVTDMLLKAGCDTPIALTKSGGMIIEFVIH